MTLGLVILFVAAALLLTELRSASNPSRARLVKLVPAIADTEGETESEGRSFARLRHVLSAIDPSFAKMEPLLRSLGVTGAELLFTIQAGRLAGAVVAAALAFKLTAMLISYPLAKFLAPVVAFLGFVWAADKAIKMASLNRRRLVRREMALGLEIFCIFLEGGQSLDQTFRSFCDVCGQALPHLAGIQRTLIADIDNGVPYEKAIGRWADNLGIEEVRPLAVLFIDSLVHGTELVPHLRQFSADLVEQRISGARAAIGVKSSQLTVVMVLFFLPAILVFLTAPAITAVTRTMGLH